MPNERQEKFNAGKKCVKASIILDAIFLVIALVILVSPFDLNLLTQSDALNLAFLLIMIMGALSFFIAGFLYVWLGTFRCWRALDNECEANNEEIRKARDLMCWAFFLNWANFLIPVLPTIASYIICYRSVREEKSIKWSGSK